MRKNVQLFPSCSSRSLNSSPYRTSGRRPVSKGFSKASDSHQRPLATHVALTGAFLTDKLTSDQVKSGDPT
jgi:hypothetical protein